MQADVRGGFPIAPFGEMHESIRLPPLRSAHIYHLPDVPPPPRGAGVPTNGYTREGGFKTWATDPTVLLTGPPPERPPPKRYPRATMEASPRSNEILDDREPTISERWPGAAEFENSKVAKDWQKILQEGQKLRDKCRALETRTVYPVWLVPKERVGQPARIHEVKARYKQAAVAKTAKEAVKTAQKPQLKSPNNLQSRGRASSPSQTGASSPHVAATIEDVVHQV
mmetsp:Transcript_10084/g.16486  ORF Transcript_10084/g.16486 Transcript_10084/m.16486 type:complete len:226 (-) Transcript_10084:79-756(-)